MSLSLRPGALFARPALFLLTLVASFVLAGFSARQAQATTYYVSPSGTGNGSTWAMAGPLQTIIRNAHSGDQVWALKGIYVGNFTTIDGVAVYGHFAGTETNINQRPLTNAADTSYLDANNSGTAYTIPSAAMLTNTLDGFTIENAPSRGINDGSSDHLVIANDTFTGDSIYEANGGGVNASGATVDISASTFSSDSVSGNVNNQGGPVVYGGGLYVGSGTSATITDCTFSSNNATAGYGTSSYGGAIYSAGTINVSGCNFSGNNAVNGSFGPGSSGGGIYAVGNSITVSDQCVFTSNTNGGVIASCTTNTITDSTFSNNAGRGVTVTGPDTSTISGCAFSNNSIFKGSGGGVYASSLITTVSSCTFTSNTVSGDVNNQGSPIVRGGGLYVESDTNATVADCTFSSNNATAGYGTTSSGGALYTASGSTTTISGCAFNSNSVTSGSFASSSYGGGFVGSGTPSLADCTFMNNSPDQVELENAGTSSSPASIKDSLIYYGTGTSAGNGIDLAISGGSVSVYVIVANNDIVNANAGINIGTGSGTGGAVSVANNIFYANNGAVNDNSTVTFASSHNDLFDNVSYKYQGNGITTSASDLMVDPMFVNGYHLAPNSPLINAGDDSYVSTGDTDLDGNPRIIGSHVDIGCYEYAPPGPTITSITPTSGPIGTVVTITGTNLGSITKIRFHNAYATTYSVNGAGTQITVTVPSGAGTGTITVTTAAGAVTSSQTFTVTTPAPTITSFTPTSGPVGTSVTITGTNFTGATAVKFNTTTATTFHVASATSITATVPTGATTGKISVTTPGGTATSSGTFTVTAPAPTITSIAPTSGPVGTVVTITGTNFVSVTKIRFHNAYATTYSVNGAGTQITVTVPSGAGTGTITVTTSAGAVTSSQTFTVTTSTLPTVRSLTFNPSTIAPGGSSTGTVTLSGVAPQGGAIVSVSQGAFTFTTVTVPAGQTTATFGVMAVASAPAGSYPFTAAYNNTSATGMLTVN